MLLERFVIPRPLRRRSWPRRLLLPLALMAALSLCGCGDMREQPRYNPHEPCVLFGDGNSARTPVAGAVARGQVDLDPAYYQGESHGQPLQGLPMPLTRGLLLRGQQRFDIFCAPCHGMTGYGDGMIVQRGFTQPPSLHSPRLRNIADGRVFQVISRGFGNMPSYSGQIPVPDRWAVVAYLRALQRSQNASLEDVGLQERKALEALPEPSTAHPAAAPQPTTAPAPVTAPATAPKPATAPSISTPPAPPRSAQRSGSSAPVARHVRSLSLQEGRP